MVWPHAVMGTARRAALCITHLCQQGMGDTPHLLTGTPAEEETSQPYRGVQ